MQEEISFGTWLRKQRRDLDLSRQAFADQVGCAQITLRRIESGTLKPSKELASILLEKLGIPEIEWPQWISFARGISGFPISVISSNKLITNLPAPLTTFIGRKKEQADVIRLVTKNRLVTLTGSGGVGKTRLSIKVGEQVLGNYDYGVWLVELASLSDPALLPQTVAVMFGLTTQSEVTYIDLIINFLRPKSVLLILDNCEHLLDACAQLVNTVLKICPNLKILATSREPLNITGEAIYRVPSLRLPNLQQILNTFRDYESIQLFEERAQLVQFDFSLTLENVGSVAQICHRLDGIPLAIELAAAHISMFSVEQIATQLNDGFNLLTGGSRTALPRHQTLRASMAWSWNLLTESEQSLMQRLSVFVGGWTLEAAQSVCDGDVLHLLNSLATKSLIVMHQRMEKNVRYSFHETIRQYAHENLLEAGGIEALRDNHLAYFVKLVEQAEPELYRFNQIFWFKKLDDELGNFRKALDWALATDVASGLRIACIPWRFWQRGEHLQELEDWLRQLLEYYTMSDSLRAQALAVYSNYVFVLGKFGESRKIAEQALQLARTLSDRQSEALSLLFLGRNIAFPGNINDGIPLLEQSLALYRMLGDKIGQATATCWLFFNNNDPELSKSRLLEGLELNRELGNLSDIAFCLGNLAHQAILAGDFSSPPPWLEETITLYRQLGDQSNEADILSSFGTLAHWQGDYQQAHTYYEQAITLYDKVGGTWSSWPRVRLAHTLLQKGDLVRARETFELSLQQFQKDDSLNGVIYTVEGLASWHMKKGHPERAARLFGWADAIRAQIGDQRPPVEQNSVQRDLAAIYAELGKSEFALLSEEGQAMTVEQAVVLALEPA